MTAITLLGLGPGDPAKLTREAWDILGSANEIWLRTRQHPTVAGLPASIKVYSFDDLYENSDSFEAVYAGIVEKVLELGRRPEGVVYAVPGDPFMAEATCPAIAQRARAEGLSLKILSLSSAVWKTGLPVILKRATDWMLIFNWNILTAALRSIFMKYLKD